MRILVYYLLFFVALVLFYFVNDKADNIFGIVSPLYTVAIIILVYYDILRRKKTDGRNEGNDDNSTSPE
ncbi:MAG: hypothetical protein C0601_11715 [Candidatus Muiribacterium halophilum]|uniref:Uncharacterized protein n=1 Tax=Muiribacterium halophilum TaxID=2053465 RepID=A0A2N5ZBG6_MUIH1|nr:MAG: hypothetical protein C0601_11715 [Candidatus Muirbacterium halophilum]